MQARVLQRNLLTLYTGLAIAIDYKLNFDGSDPDAIQGLHQRCADRLFRTCELNQGLYIKIAQAVGSNALILPPPYFKFTKMFDDVERMPWETVKQVVEEELRRYKGATMDQVFSEFNKKPIAAASVAQVHKARLRETGEVVAVKVQRPSIRKQAYWDLLSFRILLKLYEQIFNLPLSYFGGYTSDQIELETHFEVELRNAERIKKHIDADPSVNQTVTVPNVYRKFSTDRILTMEFIKGACKMTDRQKIEEDMGLNIKAVASDVCNVFAAMIFQYGFVQADGHAGNVLIRKHPNAKKKSDHQVVLIDHGLYVSLSDKFRKEYAELWRAIFTIDMKSLDKITQAWGMGAGSSELFASATLMRPWSNPKKPNQGGGSENHQQLPPEWQGLSEKEIEKRKQQQRLQKQKEVINNFLVKVELVPKELIFVARSMRIVQANNQALASPVNRINILARHAADALITTSQPSLFRVFFPKYKQNNNTDNSTTTTGTDASLTARLHEWTLSRISFLRFRTTLFILDTAFFSSALVHWMKLLWFDPYYALGLRRRRRHDAESKGGGFEDDLEKSMQALARDELGVELRSEAFEG